MEMLPMDLPPPQTQNALPQNGRIPRTYVAKSDAAALNSNRSLNLTWPSATWALLATALRRLARFKLALNIAKRDVNRLTPNTTQNTPTTCQLKYHGILNVVKQYFFYYTPPNAKLRVLRFHKQSEPVEGARMLGLWV